MMFCDLWGVSPHGIGYWFEWVYPNCADFTDGPTSLVSGFPFPYYAWAGDTSGHYFAIPHVFILNMLILSSVVYALLIRLLGVISQRMTSILKVLSITFIIIYSALTILALWFGLLSFNFNVGGGYYDNGSDSYLQLRPGTWIPAHSSLDTTRDYTPPVSEPEPQDATKNRFQAP